MIVHVIIYNSYYLSSADYYSNRVTKILVIQNKKKYRMQPIQWSRSDC